MPTKPAEEDYYAVLGLEPGATPAEVNSAYRKLSLKVHPDRYKGDDPEWATEQFLRLTRAKEVLLDDKARAAYEALRKARDAHKAKQEAQHAGRKKLREELEEREEAAKRQRHEPSAEQLRRQEQEVEAAARRELENELERLRSSGRLDPGRARPAATAAAAPAPAAAAAPATAAASGESQGAGGSETARLSLRWSADRQHTSESLTALLEELGDAGGAAGRGGGGGGGGAQAPGGLTLAIVGSKAVAELGTAAAVRLMARSVELSARGVRASWIGGPPAAAAAAAAADGSSAASAAAAPSAAAAASTPAAVAPLPPGWRECTAPDGRRYFYHTATRQTQWKRPVASAASAAAGAGAAAAGGGAGGVSAADHETLESVTMRRLRQASERQRMIEALAAEDGVAAGGAAAGGAAS